MNDQQTEVQPQQERPLRPAQTDKKYYRFLVMYLVLLSALGSFVNDMYTPSLPEMSRYFGCTASQAQLSLTFGMIGLGIGQLLMGPISDHYGRKIVLSVSLIVFITAAVVSVFSPNMTTFLFLRFVQGAGAAGGYFLARTIPADIYHGRDLAKLMALIGAVNGLAPASSPMLGGIIADHGGWKAVFIVLAAFALLVLCIAPKLKESLYKQDRTTVPWYKTIPGLPKADEKHTVHGSHKPQGVRIGAIVQLHIGGTIHIGNTLRLLADYVRHHRRAKLSGDCGRIHAVATLPSVQKRRHSGHNHIIAIDINRSLRSLAHT